MSSKSSAPSRASRTMGSKPCSRLGAGSPSGWVGSPTGCRGLLYVQLRVKLLSFDQHSGLASIYPSAAVYLAEALASLRDQDMNIRIDGFYDRVLEPTDADRQMMAKIDPDVEQRRKLVGFDRLIRDPMAEHVIEQLLF